MHRCVNDNLLGYKCECEMGYRLANDNKTCLGKWSLYFEVIVNKILISSFIELN